MISKKDELENMNFIKTIMMIVIVLYHSMCFYSGNWFIYSPIRGGGVHNPYPLINTVLQYLNLIHVQVFTFASGYIFYYLKYEKQKYKSPKDDIKRRFDRLIVPYIFTALFYVIPIYVIFYKPTVASVITKYLLCTSPSQLWFLIMLFGVFVIFYFTSDLLLKFDWKTILPGIILFSVFSSGILSLFNIDNYFQIKTILGYLQFFYLGFVIRKINTEKLYNYSSIILFFTVMVLLFFVFRFVILSETVVAKVTASLLSSLISITGILFVVSLVGMLTENRRSYQDNRLYMFLKKYSFTIYLFHQQIIYFVLFVLRPFNFNSFAVIVISFVISLVGSSAISVLLSKFSVTRKMFSLN